MTELATILPPNSTELEFDIEQVIRPGDEVRAAVDLVRTAKEAPPDDWLMFLVWEYGLEELLPYFDDLRALIAAGIPWQRIKGTPASLEMALGWIGSGESFVEEEETGGAHWFEFQIDPGMIPNGPEQIQLIRALAKISSPVRSRLARVYHGYDVRRLVLDAGHLDDHLLSDYSGIDDDGVTLSFGRVTARLAEYGGAAVSAMVASLHVRRERYEDRALLDFSRIEEVSIRNNPSLPRREVLRMSWSSVDGYEVWTSTTRDYRLYVTQVVAGQVWVTGYSWADVNSSWNDVGPLVTSSFTRSV